VGGAAFVPNVGIVPVGSGSSDVEGDVTEIVVSKVGGSCVAAVVVVATVVVTDVVGDSDGPGVTFSEPPDERRRDTSFPQKPNTES